MCSGSLHIGKLVANIKDRSLHPLCYSRSWHDSIDLFSKDLSAAPAFASKSPFFNNQKLLLCLVRRIFNTHSSAIMNLCRLHSTMGTKSRVSTDSAVEAHT